MNNDYPITFRLPKKYHGLAESYLISSGEKNLNALAQKLLISEIGKNGEEEKKSEQNLDDENAQILLAALGNSRELFLRVFEILFSNADAKKQYENIVEELQTDWSTINEIFIRRVDPHTISSGDFENEISSEIDALFENNFSPSADQSLTDSLPGRTEQLSFANLTQKSLFD